MISPAVFETEASMHSQSAQNWRNFWPVLYRPSKTAGDIILKMVILHSQSIHLLEFIIGSLGSFILMIAIWGEISNKFSINTHITASDGSVLGPVPKDRPDRPYFGRTGPPEDRSKKTERPRSFFGLFLGENTTIFCVLLKYFRKLRKI